MGYGKDKHSSPNALGHLEGSVHPRFRQYADEFFSAIALRDISWPLRCTGDDGGDLFQTFVALRMAIDIVASLEPIDVYLEDGQMETRMRVARIFAGEGLLQIAPISETR